MPSIGLNVQPTQRNYGLDVLRTTAVLLVLANHGYLVLFVGTGHLPPIGPATWASILTFLSIEWLFVLSGFLIGAMLIRLFESGGTWWHQAKTFWIRRWIRTAPLYYVFLLVNILIVHLQMAPGHYSVAYAFFSQNLVKPEAYPYFFPEAFSLATDEWFYLLLPLLVGLFSLGLRRFPKQALLLATALLILVPMIARFLAEPPADSDGLNRFMDWDRRFRRVTLYHLDATGWGVLGAMASRWAPKFWQKRPAQTALIGLALSVAGLGQLFQLAFGGPLADAWPRLGNALGLSLIAAGTVLALPWVSRLHRGKGLVPRIVDRVSLYSYSIYLLHLPLLYLSLAAMTPQEESSAWRLGLQAIVWLGFTFAGSAILYHGFEKPVSDLRERFTRRTDANPFGPASAP